MKTLITLTLLLLAPSIEADSLKPLSINIPGYGQTVAIPSSKECQWNYVPAYFTQSSNDPKVSVDLDFEEIDGETTAAMVYSATIEPSILSEGQRKNLTQQIAQKMAKNPETKSCAKNNFLKTTPLEISQLEVQPSSYFKSGEANLFIAPSPKNPDVWNLQIITEFTNPSVEPDFFRNLQNSESLEVAQITLRGKSKGEAISGTINLTSSLIEELEEIVEENEMECTWSTPPSLAKTRFNEAAQFFLGFKSNHCKGNLTSKLTAKVVNVSPRSLASRPVSELGFEASGTVQEYFLSLMFGEVLEKLFNLEMTPEEEENEEQEEEEESGEETKKVKPADRGLQDTPRPWVLVRKDRTPFNARVEKTIISASEVNSFSVPVVLKSGENGSLIQKSPRIDYNMKQNWFKCAQNTYSQRVKKYGSFVLQHGKVPVGADCLKGL